MRWCEEIWQAAQGAADGISMGTLVTAWEAGVRRDCKRWANARGPVDVVRLSIRRLGWSWPRAWEFSGGAGEVFHAASMSPALIRAQLQAAAKADLECRVARGHRAKLLGIGEASS